jgi:hypothetical protein
VRSDNPYSCRGRPGDPDGCLSARTGHIAPRKGQTAEAGLAVTALLHRPRRGLSADLTRCE